MDNILCNLCNTYEDTQEHCLKCKKISQNNPELQEHIGYYNIFWEEEQQVQAAHYLHLLLTTRTALLEENPALEAGPLHSMAIIIYILYLFISNKHFGNYYIYIIFIYI